MTKKVPWPRVALNLAILAAVVLGFMLGLVYFIAPSIIPGTDAYSKRIADEAVISVQREKESKAFAEIVQAQVLCHKAVRARTKFPTKASFDPGLLNLPQMGKVKNEPSTIGVRGRVELMNGIGVMIPHRYGCDIKQGKVIRVFLDPG